MLITIRLGRTMYKIKPENEARVMEGYAKAAKTKHKPVRPKGGTERLYPAYGESMSPAEYVSQYYTLNSTRRNFKKGVAPYGDANLAGFYEGLSDRVSVPVGVDSMEIEA